MIFKAIRVTYFILTTMLRNLVPKTALHKFIRQKIRFNYI